MNTAVAVHEPRRLSKVETFLSQVLRPEDRDALRRGMPAHVPFDRFERNLTNALMNEPKLLLCDPRQVFKEVAKIAALGLLIDSYLGEAYLITSRTGPQARIGYRGLMKLSRQSGDVSKVYAHEVNQHDTFRVRLGDAKELFHEPLMFGDRGEIIGFYAVIVYKDGETDFEIMSLQDVEKVRDRYSDGWKAFKAGKISTTPWDTAKPEMGKKTVMRRLLKRCPQSPDLSRAIRLDEDAEADRRAVAMDAPNPQLAHDSTPPHDPETGEVLDQDAPPPNPDRDINDDAVVWDDDPPNPAVRSVAEGAEAEPPAAPASGPDDFPGDQPSKLEPIGDLAHTVLMERLTGVARLGTKKLRLALGGLTVDERKIMRGEDEERLHGIAKQADVRGAGG